MAERLSNLGYCAIAKETTPGTAVTPSIFLPLYKETMATDVMLDENSPIVGLKYKDYSAFQGQREHKGVLTFLAEPNTTAFLFNMLLFKSGTTGSGPYTHSFSSNSSSDAATYTVDLLKGLHVFRYMGVKASDIKPTFDKNKMQLDVTVASLGSFTTRDITGVTGSGPYTITFNTDYDPNPTNGLVVGDICQIYSVSGNSYTSFTIASIPSATTITTSTNVSANVSGDIVSIRAQTVSLSLLAPFLWSSTQFCFASTASSALTATQTPVETGSAWELKHNLNAAGGEHRSGSLDPAALARLQTEASAKIKYFFDDPQELNRYMAIATKALVIRHYSGSYELRITLNQLNAKADPTPLETGKLIYQDVDYIPTYNTSDGQAFDVKVINNISTV